MQPSPPVLPVTASESLCSAAWRTVIYTDVFDYPLRLSEVHRYLIGQPATVEQVRQALGDLMVEGRVVQVDGFYMLPGRERVVEVRRRRQQIADEMWPHAIRYGQQIARLPFVRMVAVTGALAANNVEPDADIDYLIVTKSERLWLCRLLVIAQVRRAAREHVVLCPNYFISERAIDLKVNSLFAARELAQMIPVTGLPVYEAMRAANSWMLDWLPNAVGLPWALPVEPAFEEGARPVERLLSTRVGGWLDNWERERKVRKFRAQANGNIEANFSVDWCKGHFDGHGQRIMEAYQERLVGSENGPANHHNSPRS